MYSGDEIYDDDITSGLAKYDEAGVPSICTDWHEEEECSRLPDKFGDYCDCSCPHCHFVRKEK